MQYCFTLCKQLRLGRAVLLLVVFLGMAFVAAGQEATILGTVTDPSGGVVPNVNITITNVATGVAKVFATNEAGQYVAPNLPIGKYDVKAEAQGFKAEESKGVAINVNDRVRVDFQMKVGTKSEVVSVEANAVAVQADSSEMSSLISNTQMSELATNGRTLYSYVQLSTGTSSLTPDTQLPVPVGGNGDISFNGNRPTHNLYLLDGGENADRGGSSSNSSVMPSVDAIAETQTLASNYSSEYGLSSGGTISSAIKSGTATIHASAWEFFRNDDLDARNFFNPAPSPVSELRYNIFGFNVGGPVTFGHLYNPDKKKTFFFYNMEWRRIINGGSPINQTVPDPSAYGGDFGSALPSNFTLADKTTVIPNSGLHVPCLSQLSAAQIAAFQGAGVTQFSTPATTGPYQDCAVHNATGDTLADNPTFVAFPGNTIPTALLNPQAQALLTAGGKYGGIFPKPTTTGDKFVLPVSSPTDVKEEIVRIDQNFTDKFTVYGHFVAEQIAQNYATSMWSGDNVPSIGNTFGNPSYAGVVHAAYIISPTLVNEVAFNYNGNRIHILPAGLVAAPFTPGEYFTNAINVDNRIPQIQLGGTTGTEYTANWMPWNNKADDYQLRDDLSWTRGRHQLKMGFSWALYKKIQDWFKNTEGNYVFNGQYTGNDFADFLLGYAQNYSQDALKAAGHWDNDSYAAYFQDNWRMNNRLTLNLGLRWDGIPHTFEETNQMANFYPSLYDTADAAHLAAGGNTVLSTSPGLYTNQTLGATFYTNGMSICGQNGIPRGCVNNAWQNWQPRLGFAYDLRGNGRTIIRGGYGVMNERVQGNDVYNNAGAPPLAASVNFNNVLFNNPAVNIGTGAAASGSIPVNNVTGLDQNNYKSPRSTQFSLGVQQSLGGKSVLSVAYVGTQNRHQSFYQQIDLAPYGDLPTLLGGANCTALTTYCPVVGAPPVYNLDVPYLGYHSLDMAHNEANGEYNSLQASIRGQILKNDLTYQFGYTYSKADDIWTSGSSGGDLGTISNPYAGWKYDWGPSPFDKPQAFFANFVYETPFFRHSDNKFERSMMGGWEVSGIVTASSGIPINIGLSGSPNVCSIVPNCSNRPNITGTAHNPHTVNEWFDTSVFSTPTAGTWGDTAADSVRGPGRDNWNLSLFKNFSLSESRGSNLQFRAEFFNVWNHTQFRGGSWTGGVGANLNGSQFGQITSAWDPRIIQLALKLYF